ncbi:hypothetical protein ACFQE8_04065 [Salinirubellus sp. GCM10025818]|uniref:hypothetical protein n=1 Tax=Salinirubellus TaxID=2162630 RepID=UPI0030CEA2FA
MRELLAAIADGLEKENGNLGSVVIAILSGGRIAAAKETVAFLKRLVTEETPDSGDEIMEMSKDEMIITVYRINFFEKLRHPAVNDKQIEHLYRRVVELWGEAPTEPIGRWAEWNLWVSRHRRRNGISITGVIEGEKTVDDIQQAWVERHQAREERRKLDKMVNYERYEVPEDVPPTLRHLLFSPSIKDEDSLPETDLPDVVTSEPEADTDYETA